MSEMGNFFKMKQKKMIHHLKTPKGVTTGLLHSQFFLSTLDQTHRVQFLTPDMQMLNHPQLLKV